MKDIILNVELGELPESEVQQLKAVYEPMIKMLEKFEKEYNNLMAEEQTPEKCIRAKELRLGISKVRIASDKARKKQKSKYWIAGKAVDSIHHSFLFGIGDMEGNLKDAESFYDNQEKERIALIQCKREDELMKYSADYKVPNLGVMRDEVWAHYIAGEKANYEAVKEAERKAEDERVEDERKQKLCREREMQLAKYAQYINCIVGVNTTQSEFDELLLRAKNKKKWHEEEQAAIKIENEKLKIEKESMEAERAAREAELQKERAAREAIENERKDKEEAAAKDKKTLELAPDKEKLLRLSKMLSSGKFSIKSEQALSAISQAIDCLELAANQM